MGIQLDLPLHRRPLQQKHQRQEAQQNPAQQPELVHVRQ
jgi:hypothetical protein